MKGEWCYFKGHFKPEQCRAILDEGLRLLCKDGAVSLNGGPDKGLRKSKVRFIHPGNLDWLFKEILYLAEWANRDWFDFALGRLPFLQLAEYDAAYEGEYKRHHDVFWMNGDEKYHRKLSCIVQLTEPAEYDGNDLEFFELAHYPNREELRVQGTAIFFPSFIPHRASPITRGTRHSIAAWIEGPKWR